MPFSRKLLIAILSAMQFSIAWFLIRSWLDDTWWIVALQVIVIVGSAMFGTMGLWTLISTPTKNRRPR